MNFVLNILLIASIPRAIYNFVKLLVIVVFIECKIIIKVLSYILLSTRVFPIWECYATSNY